MKGVGVIGGGGGGGRVVLVSGQLDYITQVLLVLEQMTRID